MPRALYGYHFLFVSEAGDGVGVGSGGSGVFYFNESQLCPHTESEGDGISMLR